MMTRQQKIGWIVVALEVFVAIAYFLLYFFSPNRNDDLWYLLGCKDYYEGVTNVFPLKELVDEIIYRYNRDNIRFSTVITTITVLAPKWLSSLLFGLCAYISVYMMRGVCGLKRKDFTLSVAVIAGFVVLLPWFERMFEVAYGLNYLVPTALTTSYLYFFVNSDKYSPRQIFGILVLGFFVGWFHEGFSVPLLIGFGCFVLVNRFRISKRKWAMIAMLIPGIAIITISPSFWIRVTNPGTLSVRSVLFYNSMLWIFISLLCIAYFMGKRRGKAILPVIDRSYVVIILGTALTSVAIHFYNCLGVRVGWASELTSIMGVVIVLRNIYSGWNKRGWTIFAGMVAAFVLVHLAVAVDRMHNARTEWNDIIALYKQSADGVAFYDYSLEADAPLLALKKTYDEYYVDSFSIHNTERYYYTEEAGYRPFRVVPASMRTVNETALKKVPGDNPFYFYGRHLIAYGCEYGRPDCRVFYGNRKLDTQLTLLPFTDSNGKEWTYVYVLHSLLPSHFAEISHIEKL